MAIGENPAGADAQQFQIERRKERKVSFLFSLFYFIFIYLFKRVNYCWRKSCDLRRGEMVRLPFPQTEIGRINWAEMARRQLGVLHGIGATLRHSGASETFGRFRKSTAGFTGGCARWLTHIRNRQGGCVGASSFLLLSRALKSPGESRRPPFTVGAVREWDAHIMIHVRHSNKSQTKPPPNVYIRGKVARSPDHLTGSSGWGASF